MEEETCEARSQDDKALLEKSKKRTVKTHAQVDALEKFYDEHKYPTESLKSQLAESLGLSEKQVSGWFCHRRLKDKRLLNGEPSAIGRQDRSSAIIQDRGRGFKQDSCGSTKQGEDRNFDTKEVKSERLVGQELSAADLTYELGNHYTSNYNRMNDASSGGSSSLRNMSSCHNGNFSDMSSSKYLTPKFHGDTKGVKIRSGPSGYLKVKGQAENSAITAVKKQLGSHYREDGPPLGIEFDPLPPGAFGSSEQEQNNEPYYAGERVLRSIPDVSKILKYPNFNEEYEYKYIVSHNSDMDGTNSKMAYGSEISGSYLQQKFKTKTSTSNPRINLSVHLPEGSGRYMPGYESRDSYRTRPRHSVEVMRMESVSCHPNLQINGGKVTGEWTEPLFNKYNDLGPKFSRGGNIEYPPSNFTIKGDEYHTSEDKGTPRRTIMDAKVYRERVANEICEPARVKLPPKNEMSTSKRVRDEFSQQLNGKKPSMVDTQPCTYQLPRSVAEIPSSFSEDDESAETSSMDR
ncbi:homeobox-DDT domain RLT1-like isoform X1 [Olea europaea subsp. europaea]|uniref:Homeobox-DDT domain RLT1-like isoform X1 n=2 Tax=Olea europaea subsp. europaea TaxID=158383 RepID=A0A8S0SKV1_OLEEU|nr:homeobox-DDT domain RLT1-like isoform X1 [Olea europaea subsp. europaea]